MALTRNQSDAMNSIKTFLSPSLSLGVLALLLVSCAGTSVKEFQSPDGTAVKTVKCNVDSQKCFVAASESCAGGTYRVVSSESHAGGTLADVIPGPVTWYGMTYVCGPSDGKMPDFKWQGATYTPPPAPVKSAPSTTNCTRIGDSITCSSY